MSGLIINAISKIIMNGLISDRSEHSGRRLLLYFTIRGPSAVIFMKSPHPIEYQI